MFVPGVVTVTVRHCIALPLLVLHQESWARSTMLQILVFSPNTCFCAIKLMKSCLSESHGPFTSNPAVARSPLCPKRPIVCESCFHHHCSATLAMILNRSTELLHPQGMAAACCGATGMQVDQNIPWCCSSSLHAADWALLVE